MATAILHPTQQDSGQIFVPREHGATAMLLTPFFAAAILLRSIYWQEVVVLIAIVCAFAIKDPLVVIARQRLVWKQPHAETKAAVRSAVIEFWLMIACGIALLATRDWRPLVALFAGAAGFTAVAVRLTVRNRQRSEWFQVASAVGLSSTSIAACLAAVGEIPQWCWMLWLLSALQATAGIFVVHARLDAKIAARKHAAADPGNRRAALFCQIALLVAAGSFAFYGRLWIAAALLVAASCYLWELRRQKNPESLQMPLKKVGLQALTLSTAYALMVVAGLWRY